MSWSLGPSPKEDGSLPPIIEHVKFSRLWEEELPSFGRSSRALAVLLLWHALNSLCTCQRNWSAWGLMCSKIQSTHSGVCKEANLRALHQQAVQQERRGRPAGSWQAACSSSRWTTRKQRIQIVEFKTSEQRCVVR